MTVGPWLTRKYEDLRLVLTEGALQTWQGVDGATGRRVVVQAMQAAALSPGARLRFEHNARALGTVKSPCVASLLHHDASGEFWVQEVEVADPLSLQCRLERGPLTVPESLAVARDLLEGLAALHAVGLVHRDVNPSLVFGCRPAQLACFGSTRYDVDPAALQDPQWISALRYASPEQAGLLHQDVGWRSDLYSAGIVLYECLSGAPPFTAQDVRTLLRQQAAGTVAPLPRQVPEVLGNLVGRLLRKDPRQRYQSAQAALDDVGRLQREIASGSEAPVFLLGQTDVRDHLTEPEFVGRAGELQALDEFFHRPAPRPQLALVEAVSGGGKSRLLDEFAVRLRQQGATLVTARGRQTEAREPFQMLRQVLGGVMGEAALDADLHRRLSDIIQDGRDAIWALLPDLVAQDAERLPEMSGEFRVLAVARKMLEAVGSREAPLMLLLDDCQWADSSLLTLLQAWCGQEESAVRVVAAFRAEEVGADHALRKLPRAAHLALPPLSGDEMRALAGSMGGELPEAVHGLVEKAEGNPFRATELLRGLHEGGFLSRQDGRWHVREPEVHYSTHAANALVARLDWLPHDTLETLLAAAVLGRSFELDVVRHLAGTDVVAALDDAQQRALIWRDPGGTHCTFVHDRVREALLSRLESGRRQALHGAAACYFAESAPGAFYDRAYHLKEAGDVAGAFPHALAAAEDARARFALDVAEQQYRVALAGAPGSVESARVTEGLAEVLLLRGQYGEAESLLLRVLEVVDDPIDRARCEGRLGELYFKIGRSRDARRHLTEGLRMVGHIVPRSRAALWLDIGRQIVVQTLHSNFPSRYLARLPLEEGRGDLLACQLHEALVQTAVGESDFVLIFWSQLRSMNAIECYPPTRQLGWVWIEHGNLLALGPAWHSRAQRYMERGLEVGETRSDRLLHARGLARSAAGEQATGRLRQSLDSGTRALATLTECTGDLFEIGAAQVYAARNSFWLGDVRSATDLSREVWHRMRTAGDPKVAYAALADWARNQGGRIPESEVEAPGEGLIPLALAELQLAHGFWHLGRGEAAAAAALFAQSCATTGGQEPANHYAGRLCWEATAWRLAAAGAPLGAGRARGAYLKAARAASQRAWGGAKRVPLYRPHALRDRALLAAEAGHEAEARRLLGESLRIAEEHGNRYDFAWTLYEKGRVGLALGWPDAARNLSEARGAFHAMGLDPAPLDEHCIPTLLEEEAPSSPGLMDRFISVIEAGCAMVSCLTTEGVLEAVRKAAVDLLRPQSCTVHAPAVEHDGEARSFLHTPIVVQGRTVASFTVTHEMADYFQEEERMLAAFIAALGGAALETAESFAAVRSLSASLQERSAQLQSSLEEKDVMLREIHHRVKNNLQLIISLLNLQASHHRHPDLDAEFGDLANRIRSMALIHDFIYGEDNLAEIRMDHYLRTLVGNLAVAFGADGRTVGTVCDLAPVTLPVATAVDCGLVVNELVSNALQHAFPDGRSGTVRVSLCSEEGHSTLCVSDDGVGFDPAAPPSLGLTLVQLLSEKLGTLSLAAGPGTRATLRLG